MPRSAKSGTELPRCRANSSAALAAAEAVGRSRAAGGFHMSKRTRHADGRTRCFFSFSKYDEAPSAALIASGTCSARRESSNISESW